MVHHRRVLVTGAGGFIGHHLTTLLKRLQVLGWEPEISLEEELVRTYIWIETQVRKALAVKAPDEAQREEVSLEAF